MAEEHAPHMPHWHPAHGHNGGISGGASLLSPTQFSGVTTDDDDDGTAGGGAPAAT